MSYPYIVSSDSATLVYEGKPYTIRKGQANFPQFKSALLKGKFEKAIDFLDIPKAISNFSEGLLTVRDGEVYFCGSHLHGVVVDKLLSLLKSGMKKSDPFIKFVQNLLHNPSKSSVDELYDFLSYKALPIDEDGYVIAYKGVAGDYWSKSGNTYTVVLQGQTNDRGQIFNGVGEVIEVMRNSVDDNRDNNCSHGLHVGSFDYAKDWAGDGKLLMVRFNPADAVSVPTDCSCQKLRVSRYEILSEIEVQNSSEIKKPFYGVYTDGNTTPDYDEDDYEEDDE
jgi:hypothetical protein